VLQTNNIPICNLTVTQFIKSHDLRVNENHEQPEIIDSVQESDIYLPEEEKLRKFENILIEETIIQSKSVAQFYDTSTVDLVYAGPLKEAIATFSELVKSPLQQDMNKTLSDAIEEFFQYDANNFSPSLYIEKLNLITKLTLSSRWIHGKSGHTSSGSNEFIMVVKFLFKILCKDAPNGGRPNAEVNTCEGNVANEFSPELLGKGSSHYYLFKMKTLKLLRYDKFSIVKRNSSI